MARVTKRERALTQALEFRTSAHALLHDRYNDWTEWEFNWLSSEAQRPLDYVHSEKEWNKLRELRHYACSFTRYADRSVPELIAIAHAGRFDLLYDDQEFIEKIHDWKATQLKRRQICFLAALCRSFEITPYDPIAEYKLAEEAI